MYVLHSLGFEIHAHAMQINAQILIFLICKVKYYICWLNEWVDFSTIFHVRFLKSFSFLMSYSTFFSSVIAYHYNNDICIKWKYETVWWIITYIFYIILVHIAFIFLFFFFLWNTMVLWRYFPPNFYFLWHTKQFLSFCLFILEWKIEMNSELNWKFIAIMIYLALCCGCYILCCVFLSQLNIYSNLLFLPCKCWLLLTYIWVYVKMSWKYIVYCILYFI